MTMGRWQPALPRLRFLARLVLAAGSTCLGTSAVFPAAESLLPDNTVAAITTPDFPGLQRIAEAAPLVRFWNDPAMAPFTARFSATWNQEVITPLARSLRISMPELLGWCQGQVTIALTSGSTPDKRNGILLLLDSRARSLEVESRLNRLRGEGTNAGVLVRSETIGTNSFLILPLPRRLLPGGLAGTAWSPEELFLGQVNSWLIAGTRKEDIEQVCLALRAANARATFASRHGTHDPVILPEAAVYAWVETGPLLQAVAHDFPRPAADAAGAMSDITLDTLIQATGLGKVRTVFFSAQTAPGGLLYQMTWTIPEADRRGLIKLLAVEGKPCAMPAFVPPDILEFDRWRVDGKKAWSTLEQVFAGISPHWTNSAALILETANAAARLKDPTFDIQTNLFNNLGDDVIVMVKPTRKLTPEAISSPPTLYLVSSPNPPQLASALGSLFLFFDREAESPKERVFADTPIRSVPLPSIPLPDDAVAAKPDRKALHYAPARGYVALSTDAAFLEQFLDTTNSPTSNVLAKADFPAAVRLVVTPETGLFGFADRLNLVRSRWPRIDATNAVPVSQPGLGYGFLPTWLAATLPSSATNWFDPGLLPPVKSVESYFHYTVYGGGAYSNGLTWRMFEPAPQLPP